MNISHFVFFTESDLKQSPVDTIKRCQMGWLKVLYNQEPNIVGNGRHLNQEPNLQIFQPRSQHAARISHTEAKRLRVAINHQLPYPPPPQHNVDVCITMKHELQVTTGQDNGPSQNPRKTTHYATQVTKGENMMCVCMKSIDQRNVHRESPIK